MQIGVDRLIGNSHGSSTQFDRFLILANHDFVMLKTNLPANGRFGER